MKPAAQLKGKPAAPPAPPPSPKTGDPVDWTQSAAWKRNHGKKPLLTARQAAAALRAVRGD